MINNELSFRYSLHQANLVAAQMYDAVYLYARSVERAVERGFNIKDGAALVKLMADMSWTGQLTVYEPKAHIYFHIIYLKNEITIIFLLQFLFAGP